MPSVLKFCQIFLVASPVLKNSTTVFTPAPVKTPPGKSSTACRLQVSSRDGWTMPAFLRLWGVGLGLGGAGGGLRSSTDPLRLSLSKRWKLFGARLLVSGCFNVLCQVVRGKIDV